MDQYSEHPQIAPEKNRHYENALECLSRGEYKKAFDNLSKIPGEDEYKYNKGEILFLRGWCLELAPEGDNDQALQFYLQAAAAASVPETKMNSHFRAGWLLMQKGEHSKAAECLEKILSTPGGRNNPDEIYRHAAFWQAFCVETLGCYLEALDLYRSVLTMAPLLAPEARFREIMSLIQIGSYAEALGACDAFDAPPPDGFDPNRYAELRSLVSHQKDILLKVLNGK